MDGAVGEQPHGYNNKQNRRLSGQKWRILACRKPLMEPFKVTLQADAVNFSNVFYAVHNAMAGEG